MTIGSVIRPSKQTACQGHSNAFVQRDKFLCGTCRGAPDMFDGGGVLAQAEMNYHSSIREVGGKRPWAQKMPAGSFCGKG